jgi:hypothetical protein
MLFFLGFELEIAVDSVLIQADGPRLCAGTDFAGQRWLVFRSFSDEDASLWLCSPISDRALRLVKTGRATARDAFRHSSTGLVEVVSYVEGRVVPERCLTCAEIPDSLLPSADLVVNPKPVKPRSDPGRQRRRQSECATLRPRKWETEVDPAGHPSRFPIDCSRPLKQAG